MAGLWGTGDDTFVLARLGPLHLGMMTGPLCICKGAS